MNGEIENLYGSELDAISRIVLDVKHSNNHCKAGEQPHKVGR
jgi:hypothetical protein